MTSTRNLRCTLVALAAVWLSGPGPARAVEHDPGIWTVISSTDTIQSNGADTRWHYWFDAQARYFDVGSGVNQWLARPAIGYEIRDGVRVWLGYARFRSRNQAGNVADENRVWQQVDWRAGNWNGGSFSVRARLLERSVSTGDDLGLTLRVMTRYTRPMSNDRNLVVSLEPFFALRDTDWEGKSGLRQNRLFIGTGFDIGDQWYFETGYMNQYVVADAAANRSNHLAILRFRLKL